MKVIVAMILVALLETYAIHQGIDGAALAGALAIISGLGGYAVKRKTSK